MQDSRIERFATTLTQAVGDALLERSPGLRFFCDANVILDMIFSAAGSSGRRVFGRRELLARALLSAGLIAKVHVLRPHLIEIDQRLRTLADDFKQSGRSHNEYAGEVAQDAGVRGAETDFLSLVRQTPSELPPESESEYIELLRSHGADALIVQDLYFGPWQRRLRALTRETLSLSTDPMASRQLHAWDADLFGLYRCLEQARPDRPRNNARDAMALLELASLNEAHLASPRTVPAVRFITHDGALLRLLDERTSLASRFRSVHASDERGTSPDSYATVFRSYQYLLMRAAFPSLRQDEDLLAVGGESGSTLDLARLVRLSSELGGIRQPGTARAGVWPSARLSVAASALDELAKSVEDLSFVRNAVLHPSTRKRLLELRRAPETEDQGQLSNLRDFVGTRLARELHEFENYVRVNHKSLMTLNGQARALMAAALRVSDSFRFGIRVPDFERDLGGVRWGLVVSEVAQDEWRARLAVLLGGVGRDAAERMAEHVVGTYLAPRGYRIGSEARETASAAAIALWACSCNELVVSVANSVENGHGKALGAGWQTLRTAARLRSGFLFSQEEREAQVVALRKSVENDSKGVAARALLGLAYCIFHTSFGFAEEKRRELVRVSFDVGKLALERLSADPLGKAFAVNHCAYVSLFAREDSEAHIEGFHMRDQLRGLRGEERVWNYRFEDTLAWSTFSEARDATGRLRVSESRERVKSAVAALEGCGPTYGDLEIRRHLSDMKAWLEATGESG